VARWLSQLSRYESRSGVSVVLSPTALASGLISFSTSNDVWVADPAMVGLNVRPMAGHSYTERA
jgi:hypothetical protein